jgi:hypothetical protein
MTEEKIRENRLRRAASRQGLSLRKSRRRDPQALEYGRYWLIDPYMNAMVAGGQWGYSLDDIEEELRTREVTR